MHAPESSPSFEAYSRNSVNACTFPHLAPFPAFVHDAPVKRILHPSPLRLRKTIVILACVGATLGVLLDAIHSHFGATTYTDPIFAKTAWWVPLLFASAYTAGIARPIIDREPIMPPWKPALGMGLFVVAYALTVAPLDLSSRVALLIAIFATGFRFCDPSRTALIVAMGGGFIGPVLESILVRAGTFVHHEAHIAGVPVWLPVLYMNAGIGLGTFASWLVQNDRSR
jgi:hypothetical protein